MTVIHNKVPQSVIPRILDQLRAFGCEITLDTETSGLVSHHSGKLRFSHDGQTLTVEILEYRHFQKNLLIGGMRQLIEEAAELRS